MMTDESKAKVENIVRAVEVIMEQKKPIMKMFMTESEKLAFDMGYINTLDVIRSVIKTAVEKEKTNV
jgi:hypothetical protein